MAQYRIVTTFEGGYRVEYSEPSHEGYWYNRGCPDYPFMFLAKRTLHKLVKEDERLATKKAFVPKVVYGPYPP